MIPLLCLLGGIAIGAIFYPSKTITREVEARYESTIDRLENEKKSEREQFAEILTKRETEHKEYRRETDQKMSSLRTENTELKQKTKETIVKIVKPDGTITEKTIRTSDTQVVSQIVTDIKQEFNEKVSSIEEKWKQVHEDRVKDIKKDYERQLEEKQKEISYYSKKETIKVNERKFGVSLGYTKNDTYFSSITYSVFGPFFLDVHLEADPKFVNSNGGVGLGFSF